MPSPCANLCGHPAKGPSRFCAGCLVQPPLVHPTLLPDAYLQACGLELARRGASGGGGRMHQVVEDAWDLARGKLCTLPTGLLTSEGKR